MAELNFKKLADAPILEEVPDGAKVYAEVDGKVYRVAGDNLGGGGIPTAIFTLNTDADASPYTATCDNMTFAEAKAIFESGGQVNALLCVSQPGENAMYSRSCSVEGNYVNISGTTEIISFTFVSYINNHNAITFLWQPDETIIGGK